MPNQNTPSEMYLKVLAVIRFCCRMIGVDVADKEFKINLRTRIVMSAIFCYYLFSAHTIKKYVMTDWTILLDVFAPVSCNTQGMVKFIAGLYYAKIYCHLTQELGKIYDKYQKMGQKYDEKLLEWNKSMKKILVGVAIVYFMTALLVLSTPLLLYIFKGERHLVFLVQVPGFEVDTTMGYWVTNGFQAGCVVIALFGLYAGDLFLLLFLTHAIFFYDIFALKVSDLHELMELDTEDKRITELVDDIVAWHQYYLEFNSTCNLIFFWTISVHIVCTTLGILSTLLLIMLKDWPGAYCFIFVNFLWLYMYCALGTRVELCNDRFCRGVYDINWYGLNVRNQKHIRLMLLQSQVPRDIMIAGVEPLSVNTALKITRTIYSLVMMVLRFQSK